MENIQPCEVIESNLLDPTKPTDLKTEFAEIKKDFATGGTTFYIDGKDLIRYGQRIKRTSKI